MSTKVSPTSKTHNPDYHGSFLVTREEIIGEVRPGNGDFLTPVHAALDLVATQVADGMYGVFRFPSAEQGRTFMLHITKEGDSDNG